MPQPPGRGGDVSALSLSFYPPFTPLEQNPALQEINRQLNATLRLNFASPTDYLTRFNTTIAGGNLPDLLQLGIIPNAAEFLDSQCADLTPYLSGDAGKTYPNLANLPTLSWKSTIYNGKIMGVPPPRSAPSSVMYVNRARYDQEIGNTTPKNAEALLIDYGVEGADYTWDERNNPISTQRGPADSTYVEYNLIMQHLPVLYDAQFPEFARAAQGEQQVLLHDAIQNPTLGYYSATNLRRGATLDQAFNDGISDVVTGRRPMNDLDQIVKDWVQNGGDQIRQEYQQSMAAA